MENFELIKGAQFRIGMGIDPNQADIAIVSIDSEGTPGNLNSHVLREYGYSVNDLPKANKLKNGFSQIPASKRKPILFVVTLNGKEETSVNLANNLLNALKEFRGLISKKIAWIPLMGTGDAGMALEESYSITVRTINKFLQERPTDVEFIISLPDDNKGRRFLEKFENRRGANESSETNLSKEQEAEKFLKNLSSKLYLVGSIWNDAEDQTERFITNNIWENGYGTERYSEIVNQINKNDFLVIKSTFASKEKNYLRLKAIGIVTDNPRDGTLLNVDWRLKDLKIDIEDLGRYRYTISPADSGTAIKILVRIDRSLWDQLIPITEKANPDTIIGLLSDTDKGADYLDVSKDVNAFARVMASKSFEPPLAIALFGKWGAGKSFFMRKLKEQIIILSQRNTNEIYCKGIAHIHFNAWSYMDANLWASIITKIFEGLNDYISENSNPGEAKKEIERQLTNQLSITKEEIGVLEKKKEFVNQQITSMQSKREQINDNLIEKIKEIKTHTVWNILEDVDNKFKAREKIIQSLDKNSSFVNSEGELKKIISEKYWKNPEEAYHQIKSKYTFLKEFFRRDRLKWNLLWLVLILSIIFLVPLVLDLFSLNIGTMSFLIPQTGISFLILVGAAWRRAETVYNQLQPVIASFWSIKQDYEKQVKESVAKFEQEEKALNLEIERGKSEISLLDEQIQKSETIKTDLEFKINHALATEALYSFIDKRSKSEDYKKHLGIISIIRKDFEILNNLFTGHNLELNNSKEAEEFKSKFKKPLERIILYIDDLDRCPEENVVQVLEAVNLLMAFPLFIVIVGVDSRWIKNALIKKHSGQFIGKPVETESIGNGIELIEPSNYLEKIFQVPFHLKDATDSSVQNMIKQVAQTKPIITDYLPQESSTDLNSSDREINTFQEEQQHTVSTTATPHPSETQIIDKPEVLILTEDEINVMQDMSAVIGNNPRAIKRFINIYRIIKAHEGFKGTTDINELTVILFLIALPLGIYKKLYSSFETFIMDENNNTKPILSYFQKNNEVLKNQLAVTLSGKSRFRQLQNTRVEVFAENSAFIRRFTFNNI